uniref:Putative tail protein n=2 Tax=viral metagenome TaxID=1070528 RepID=A0A6H1ZKL3_9ZZZZ
MSGVTAAGINVEIGLKLDKIDEGLKYAKGKLKAFRDSVRQTRIEAAITGDPFALTNKYIKASKLSIQRYGEAWAHFIKDTNSGTTVLSKKVETSTKRMAKAFGEFRGAVMAAKKASDSWTNYTAMGKYGGTAVPKTGKELMKAIPGLDVGGIGKGGGQFKDLFPSEMAVESFKKNIAAMGTVSKSTQAVIDKMFASIDKGSKVSKSSITRMFNELAKGLNIAKEGGKAAVIAYRDRARHAQREQEAVQAQLQMWKHTIKAQEKVVAVQSQIKRLEASVVMGRRLGINVERELMQLTALRISRSMSLTKEQLKLSRLARLEEAGIRSPAGMREDILKRRAADTRTLRRELKRLRIEKDLGIRVDKNATSIAKKIAQLKEMNIRLTIRETAELKKYNVAQQKQSKSQAFLGADWLKNRMVWFLQLRGAWALYRGWGTATKDLADFHEQLARALRTARPVLMSVAETAKEYADTMRMGVERYGVEWEKTGEVLYQLGSAGLSAEESLAAFNSTLALTVALEGDARETTKAVASIYNVFGKEIKKGASLGEKFDHINNVIAKTWRTHQMELNEYVDALKMSAAMAKIAGISFERLSAIIGVAHNHMIKAGRAGRALQGVLMRISRTPVEFAKAFGLQDIFRPEDPFNFSKIMDALFKRMKEGTMTAYELSNAFERMGLRNAAFFVTMVKNWDQVTEAEKKYYDGAKTLDEITDTRLRNIRDAWKITIAQIRSEITGLIPFLDTWSDILIRTAKGIQQRRGIKAGKESISGVVSGKKEIGSIIPSDIEGIVAYQKFLRQFRSTLKEEETVRHPTYGRLNKKIIDSELAHIDAIYKRYRELTLERIKKQMDEDKAAIAKGGVPTSLKGIPNYLELMSARGKEAGISERPSLVAELVDKQDTLTAHRATLQAQALKPGVGEPTLKGMADAEIKYMKEIEELKEKIRAIDKKERSDLISILKLEADSLSIQKEGLTSKMTEARIEGVSAKDKRESLDNSAKIEEIDKRRAELKYQEAVFGSVGSKQQYEELEIAGKRLEQANKTAEIERKTRDAGITSKATRAEIAKLTKETQERVQLLSQELMMAKLRKENETEILKIEKASIDAKIEGARLTLDLLQRWSQDDAKKQSAATKVEELETERVGIVDRLYKSYNSLWDERARRLKDYQDEINLLKTVEDIEKERMQLGIAFGKKVEDIRREWTRVLQTEDGSEGIFILVQQGEAEVKLARELYIEQLRLFNVKKHNLQIEQTIEKEINKLKNERADIEFKGGDNKIQLLEIDKQILATEMKALQLSNKSTLNSKELDEVQQKIIENLIKMRGLNKELRLEGNLLARTYEKLKNSTGSLREASEKWMDTAISSWGTGLGNVLTDVTGGFQQQRQEIINLESELSGLQEQWEDAMDEKDLERAASIADEMERIRHEVEKLQNPLLQTGQMLRTFFKEMVDNVRKAINEWIALKIAMAVVGLFTTPAAAGAGAGGTIPTGGGGSTMFAAHGGILPSIDHFKSFSRGGMTSRPTLAVLGDNSPSNKEIVIPEENIKADSVSGYSRESGQDIYIANFLTKSDLALAMADTEGRNVVINHVMSDIGKHGAIWKKMSGGR